MTARRFFRDIFPVLIWLCVIFSLSTDNGSAAHTNSLLDRFLKLYFGSLFSHWSFAQLDALHYAIRKAAHITEYLVLAILMIRAIPRSPTPLSLARAALLAWGAATVYAMTDEFHQRFVSSRTPKATDMIFDSCGALIGVVFVVLLRRVSQKRRRLGGASSADTSNSPVAV